MKHSKLKTQLVSSSVFACKFSQCLKQTGNYHILCIYVEYSLELQYGKTLLRRVNEAASPILPRACEIYAQTTLGETTTRKTKTKKKKKRRMKEEEQQQRGKAPLTILN